MEDDSVMMEAFAALAPSAQAAWRRAAAEFAKLSAVDQQATLATAYGEQADHQADQVVEATLDAIRRGRTAAILPRLAEAAADFVPEATESGPFAAIPPFIYAVMAVLQGQAPPAVPPRFAAKLAEVRASLEKRG